MNLIHGYCPACGSGTLFVGDGHVTCSLAGCPEPDAADSILSDPETEHIVQIGETEFTVCHPLIERAAERLMDCDLHKDIAALSGPPVQPGRYRVWPKDNSGPSISLDDVRHLWDYERLDTA